MWDENLEMLKAMYQDNLEGPLETYFKKTPSQIVFLKKMPAILKISLINAFFKIHDHPD